MRCETKQNNSCSVDNTLANRFTPNTLHPVSVGVTSGVDNCTLNALFIECAQGEIMEKVKNQMLAILIKTAQRLKPEVSSISAKGFH